MNTQDQFIDGNPKRPHIFVQWKGTNVCADVYCTCGEQGHVDDDFMYYVKCPKCGTLYEVGCHITLRSIAELKPGVEPGCIKTWETGDGGWK